MWYNLSMNIKKITTLVLVISTVLFTTGTFFLSPQKAIAGSLTTLSDTMSNENASGNSTHLIKFRSPTALDLNSSGSSIIITFPTDFDFTNSVVGDLTMKAGPSTGLENTILLQATPDTTHWGAAFSGTNLRVLTLTGFSNGTGSFDIIGNSYITVSYGTASHAKNATTTGSKTITITTTSDTGSLAVPIITNDQVTIDATVAPTITFTNDQTALHFGTLSTTAAQWASTSTSGSSSDTVGNTFTISTNANSGYNLTYAPANSLTSGSNTIAAAAFTNDVDGTPGTAQFAMSAVYSGTIGNLTTAYQHATGNGNWKFVATGDTLVANTSPLSSSETVAMHYLANISSFTPAGVYTQTNTWIATGNF